MHAIDIPAHIYANITFLDYFSFIVSFNIMQ